MVKYTMMKRLTQILASILFIITVLTIYLAFDFVLNNTVPKKYSTDKHEHIHDDGIIKKPSSDLFSLKRKKSDEILKHNNDNEQHDVIDQDRRTRSVKQKQQHGKPAQFHKSKTGIKLNQLRKSVEERRKRVLTTKTTQRKDMKSKIDKTHV